MNRSTRTSFVNIQGAAANFQKNIADALMRYKSDRDAARSEAAQFKNEEEKFTAMNAALKANARAAIQRAEKRFTGTVTDELQNLKKEFALYMASVPSQMFVNTLSLYRDFSIKPGHTEILSLIEMSGGNSLALRCLNSTLESVGSDYRVVVPSADEFEADLATIDRLSWGDLNYSPGELHREACAVYGGQPVVFHRADGSSYEDGTQIDSIRLISSRAAFESTLKSLENAAERWSNSVVPSIVARETFYKDRNDATAEEQFEADVAATAEAAQIVRNPAAPMITPANRTAEIMANYTK